MANIESWNQDPLGIQARRVSVSGLLETWVGPLSGGRFAAALFNRSPQADRITLEWAALNATDSSRFAVRDIWGAKNLGVFHQEYGATVPPQATLYLILSPA